MNCFTIFIFAYTDGLAYSHAEFGASSGPIFLDSVTCSSGNSQLLECFSSPILTISSYCTNVREAGVGCEGIATSLNVGVCLLIIHLLKLHVSMVMSDLLVVIFLMKEEWKSV